MTNFEIIIISCLVIYAFLILAIIILTNRPPRRNSGRWEKPENSFGDFLKPDNYKEPIKMKNGKDGMMWGGNNYTIKTKR